MVALQMCQVSWTLAYKPPRSTRHIIVRVHSSKVKLAVAGVHPVGMISSHASIYLTQAGPARSRPGTKHYLTFNTQQTHIIKTYVSTIRSVGLYARCCAVFCQQRLSQIVTK